MFLNRCCENENMATAGTVGTYGTADMGMNMNPNMMGNGGCGCVCPPVMECPQERVCHRQMNYEVPHIIPVNTRIVNHHVYRHTYQPVFTCTMEDEVSNVYDNRCGC